MQNERTTELEWPDFYPENCPPAGVERASGTVYHLVQHDPPQTEDFITYYEENPKFFESNPHLICKGCGVSVYTDLRDIRRLKKRSKKLKNRHIAEGKLNPTLGRIQHTPSRRRKSHHTWWVPIGIKSWSVFKVISK